MTINSAKANANIRVTLIQSSAFPEKTPVATPIIIAIIPKATDKRLMEG